MTKTQNILVGSIIVPYDRRSPDPATVAALKTSLAEVGLLNPILIQRDGTGHRCYLVAGRNRLQAARDLGWETIDVIELPHLGQQEDATTLARLAEVAENLHRREITALERDELVVRWAELVEQRAGQVAQPVPAVLSDGRKAGPQHKAKADGIRQTARELGMSRESVRRAMKVGNLSQEAKQAAREHGLANNRGALLEAAKEDTPEAQVATLQQRAEAVKPKAAPAPKAQAKVEPQPDGGKGLANLLAAWKAATEAERQQFLNEIGRA